jgi:hypothetical protein
VIGENTEDRIQKTEKYKRNMRDFTLTIYKKLLLCLQESEYKYLTFAEFMEGRPEEEKLVILRHDVDKKSLRALRTAEMENELGIKGTYYFRVVKNELPKEVIERVAKLGHEIGYHYNDLNAAGGVVEKALDLFGKNLAKLRELTPVNTACMHGSPLSKYDNRKLWESHNYRDFGIIGEPYFDIDFNEVMYLTDTGRRWDGDRVSIRDKVIGDGLWVMGDGEKKIGDRSEVIGDGENRGQKEKDGRGAVCSPPGLNHEIVNSSQESVDSSKKIKTFKDLKLHSTKDIIKALDNDLLPDKIMLTIHPQRWNDRWLPWIWELGWQNMKNGVKYFIVKDKR